MTVDVVNRPAAVYAGQNLTVDVSYSKPANTTERRLVFILELRRVADDVVISKWTRDNSNLGYPQASGTISFSVSVPGNASGQLYFAAYAVPWSMNRVMVSSFKMYPTNGVFTYLWSGGGYGVTRNIYYLGSLIAPKPSGNTTYCSGLAFDSFMKAFQDYNTTYSHALIGTISSAAQMEAYRKIWYGVTDAEKLAVRAIPEYGLGIEITDFEEAQEGDACQFWRHSSTRSGHNPVFVNWVRNGSGQITGVRYWGSQGSSNGIGYHTEYFGPNLGQINVNWFYLARCRKPRDQADYDWALGQVTTKTQPTAVTLAGVENWAEY